MAKLTAKQRANLPAKAFGLPEKAGLTDDEFERINRKARKMLRKKKGN